MGSIQQPSISNPAIIYDFDPPSKDRAALYGWDNTSPSGYSIDETPSGLKRPLRVIAVGAGAAGINFAKFAQDRLENIELTIYDKNYEVGGTWVENVYPLVAYLSTHQSFLTAILDKDLADSSQSGCACDIPSVTYQYTWEPKVWSKYYSEV